MAIKSEFQTYDYFANWVSWRFCSQNNTKPRIFQGTRFANLECDLIAVRKHERCNKFIIISVEVKISNFRKVLEQAIVRSQFSNYTYIAIAGFSDITYNIQSMFHYYEQLKKHKIGVLVYDELRHQVYEFLSAHNNLEYSDLARRKEIIDYFLNYSNSIENYI